MATTTTNLSHNEYADTQPGAGISGGWRELIRLYELFVIVAMFSLALTVLLTEAVSPLVTTTGLLLSELPWMSFFILSGELVAVTVPAVAIAGALVVNLIAIVLGVAIYRRLLR